MGTIGGDGYGRFWVPTPPGAGSSLRSGGRVITPHAAVSAVVFGSLPLGTTHLHDCDVRLCVNTNPGHLRRGTQRENVRQAVARGYNCGPKPGMVDIRGPAGASRAIQDAIATQLVAGPSAPAVLAHVPAAVIAAGYPMVDVLPLFAEPRHVPVPGVDEFPADLFAVPPTTPMWAAAAHTISLFDL